MTLVSHEISVRHATCVTLTANVQSSPYYRKYYRSCLIFREEFRRRRPNITVYHLPIIYSEIYSHLSEVL